MNRTFEHYKDYLSFIENSVVQILVHERTFSETAEIIRNNPRLNKGNSFFNWLMSAYVSDITIRIRRLVDKRKDVQSLIKFLEEVKNDNNVRLRSRYIHLYIHDPILLRLTADTDFDKLAGKGASEYSKKSVQKDITIVQEACKSIIEYTNTFIAHSKANVKTDAKKRLATFEDVRKAIKTLDQIVIKYFWLIKGSDRGKSLIPNWQYDWKAIFKIPWSESS